MRIILSLLCVLLMYSSVFAFSDTGLLKGTKKIGYFIMPRTSFSNYSSGLVYSEKQADQSEIEVLYISYRSPYLLSSNITQLNLGKKYELVQLGPLVLSGSLGLGLLYQPSAYGLTFNLGGVASADILDNSTLSGSMNVYMMSGGFWLKMLVGLNHKLFFADNYEIFGGFCADVQMQTGGTEGGNMNGYYVLGLKKAL